MDGKSVAPEVGGPADFLLLNADSPELGLGELYSDLVYAASGSVVDTTVVAGKALMRSCRRDRARRRSPPRRVIPPGGI
jgi:cytosine/adenosine deaminase-related metal-dependent hydrolase